MKHYELARLGAEIMIERLEREFPGTVAAVQRKLATPKNRRATDRPINGQITAAAPAAASRRVMSAAGRKAIAAAQRKRWRKIRAEKAAAATGRK